VCAAYNILYREGVLCHSRRMATEKVKDSLNCSTPRKSLVKGERFVRFEVKPELSRPVESPEKRNTMSAWRSVIANSDNCSMRRRTDTLVVTIQGKATVRKMFSDAKYKFADGLKRYQIICGRVVHNASLRLARTIYRRTTSRGVIGTVLACGDARSRTLAAKMEACESLQMGRERPSLST
jgi:hypothetical protein